MSIHPNNRGIILIGMPGAGKSTLGVLLAKELAFEFIDTDLLIQVQEGKTLQQIMDETDYLNLRRIEEQVLLTTDCRHAVVSTGGSAIYSDVAMQYLKRQGLVVFLNVSMGELENRIHNYQSRGIARRPEQSFKTLFEERQALYQQWADVSLDCDCVTVEETLQRLLQAYRDETA